MLDGCWNMCDTVGPCYIMLETFWNMLLLELVIAMPRLPWIDRYS